jgi:hypothetical protein
MSAAAKVLQFPEFIQMECSSCGASATAGCNCGAPYLPAGQHAATGVAATPGESDRAIAKRVGVGSNTVLRARNSTAPSGAVEPQPLGRPKKSDLKVETRVGLDGKVRKLPKKRPKINACDIKFDDPTLTYKQQAELHCREATNLAKTFPLLHAKDKAVTKAEVAEVVLVAKEWSTLAAKLRKKMLSAKKGK